DVEHTVVLLKDVFERLAEELHSHVLERQRRSFGETDERHSLADLGDRNDLVSRELSAAVRCGGEASHVLARDVCGEETDDLGRQLCIRQRTQPLELGVAQLRKSLRHSESAVGSKPLKEDIAVLPECAAACGDV